MGRSSLFPVCTAALWLLTQPAPVEAHPIHTGGGEAHFNAATRRLEVSLAVFADDLETALTVKAGRPVTLEKTPAREIDAALLTYLKSSFQATSKTGLVQPLNWVGRGFEAPPAPALAPASIPAPTPPVDDTRVVLYFEIPLPDGMDGLTLKYHLLTETFPDQKNILLIHDGPRRTSLAFTASSPAKPVIFPHP